MAQFDKVLVRFRGVVASNITGVFGDTVPDLACVDIDGSGELVVSAAGVAKGVIWTPEGKSDTGVANYNVALAGSTMTVLVYGEIVGDIASPTLTAGETIWSAAAGDVVDAAPAKPAQKVGFMAASAEGDPRLIIAVAQIGDEV
jgi:hypothetical protein